MAEDKKEEMLKPDDYKIAIEVQSACNLGALAHSFSRAIQKIQNEARIKGHGTDWINNHPICRMYAEQFNHLTRNVLYHNAHSVCEKESE
jgi:hypothetical protein